MEIKKSWDPSYTHRIIFKGLDIETMAAAAKERINNQTDAGEMDEIPQIDFNIADWVQKKAKRTLKTSEFDWIARQLEEFHKDTVAAIKDIRETIGSPPFSNDFITERVKLGRHALKLAAQLNNQTDTEGIDDIEAEFSSLLAEQPPDGV